MKINIYGEIIHMATNYPIKGDSDKKLGAIFAPLSVSAQDIPNLTVKIRAGSFFNSHNNLVEFSGGNSLPLTIPSAGARWSIIGLTDSGAISITDGTAGSAPSVPTLPQGVLPLAAVFVTSSSTAITTPMINDVRPYARSIDNVPNLSAELVNRPTFNDVNNLMVEKSDTDGTPSPTFTFNKDFFADTPSENIEFVVKRGYEADVSIRWNESADVWEFTNDGTIYHPFVSTVGSFAPLVHTHIASDITDFNTSVDSRITSSVFSQSQVTNLSTDLAAKALNSDLVNHTTNSSIHFTLPIAQSDVTGLVTALDGKVDAANPGVLTDTLTVKSEGNQPISLVSSDTGSSGLLIDRSSISSPNAKLEWDESSDAWLIGTVGSMNTVLTNAIVLTKADKVSGATVGNLAGLDSEGNITDSGSSPSSFTQANSPIVGGTYPKITFDSKGLVTGGATLDSTDLPLVTPTAGGSFNKVTIDNYGRVTETNPVASGDIIGTMTAGNHMVLVGPLTGGPLVPTFRALDPTDIPNIAQSQVNGLISDLALKYDEVVAVDGHFVSFASTGATLADSGYSFASFATAAQGGLADSALQTGDIGVSIQAYDADLDAIAALTGNSGFLKTDGAGIWSVDTDTYSITGHSHVISDVTNLQDELDGKYDEISGTNGNLVSISSDGATLSDSGVAASDVLPKTVAVKGTAAVTFGAIATSDVGISTNTITVTGASVGDIVSLGLPSAVPTGFTYVGYVSAADTVTIIAHGSASSGTNAGDANATINAIVFKYASF